MYGLDITIYLCYYCKCVKFLNKNATKKRKVKHFMKKFLFVLALVLACSFNTKTIHAQGLAGDSKIVEELTKLKTGYTTAVLNIRKKPNTDSKILGQLQFNEKIEYTFYKKGWYTIEYKDETAYISSKYVSDKKADYTDYDLPKYGGFKSYEPYTVFGSSSNQGQLQNMAYTGTHGIRMVDGRYCVAVGTAVLKSGNVGSYIDLILRNGTVIPAIIGDFKAVQHTDSRRLLTIVNPQNPCGSEFIVSSKDLDRTAKNRGDISYVNDEEWDSPVETIRVYSKNILGL